MKKMMKVPSVDLSNIEKNTLRSSIHPNNGGTDSLMESYITKINDTTHEDFKELINMINE